MTNYFVEKLKVPSAAIQAMVDGLREIPDENFKVDMYSFGRTDGEVCYGCAATCAVQQIEQKRFKPWDLSFGCGTRVSVFEIPGIELLEFEKAIDRLRQGDPYKLLHLFGVVGLPSVDLPVLGTYDYIEHLEAYEDYANKLREIGL